MRSLFRILAVLLGFLSSVVIVAALETCPDIVGDALDTLDDYCDIVGRNEACYGNGDILAFDFTDEVLETFANRGDIIEIMEISNMSLSGLDEDLGIWGVAVMSVQADIPDTLPGQNVTIILFGNTELTTVEGDASSFIFSGGIGNSSCNEAPDGMLIQTPEGVGKIHITMNNIDIELGSTAYITAEAEVLFTFALLEGNATLKTDSSEINLTGSQFTSIEMDENLQPVGEFDEVLSIENHLELPQLPIQLLPRDISEAASGDRIVPRAGQWMVSNGTGHADNCPEIIATTMLNSVQIRPEVLLDFGGEDWDFETFLRTATPENTGQALLEGTYTQPEPNVYVYHTTDPEVPFSFGLHLISDSHMTGYYYFDMREFADGCEITIEFEATLID